MTNTEFNEIKKIFELKHNKDIYGNQYDFQENKVIVTGNIPRQMIQELVLEDSRFESFLTQLSPKDGNKKYLSKLELNTKEEFIMVLLSIDDFSLRERTGLVGNSKDQFNDILAEVINEIMTRADLKVTTSECLRQNPKLSKMAFDTMNRINKKPLFKTKKSVYEQDYNHNVVRNINNFDTAVNPYLLVENNFKPLEEILQSVYMDINIDEFDTVTLEITSKKDNNSVKYTRDNKFISYEVTYIDKDETKIIFTHKYHEEGETITVNKEGRKMVYNLTTGKVIVNGLEDSDKDNKYKDAIYQTILTATVYATEITDENMLKKKIYKYSK